MPNPGDKVSVHYTGTLDDGSQFDSSIGRAPLEFEMGAGQLIPGFEAAVADLAVGETARFRIEAEEAYGPVDPTRVVEFPADVVPDGLSVGARVDLNTGAVGVVTEVTDAHVSVDLNHPLAGEALTFEVELVSVGGAS